MKTPKSTALRFGLISGSIILVMILCTAPLMGDEKNFKTVEVVGMCGMALALSMIYFAIRSVRDKLQGGFITFNQAFRAGITVTLISSLVYVAAWMVFFNFIDSSFIDTYTAHQTSMIESGSGTAEEKQMQVKALEIQMDSYRKPLGMFTFTFMEIMPFGFAVTLICCILMKRQKQEDAV
jgi:hypothetical protein